MNTTKWFTLGAAAALIAATPAFASDAPCPCSGHADKAAHGEHAAPAKVAKAATGKGATTGKAAKGRVVKVAVTSAGFVPAEIPAKKGEVLNLVVTRTEERTCATEVVQKEQGVHAPLPLNEPVTVTLTAPPEGQLTFSCAHGHIAARIVSQ
jgi:hypothetical protein